jgi:peptidoglycan/LPS O-acetylase OafA/YrhL
MQKLRRLFQRHVSDGRSFIPELDGLRFMALTSVVIFHIYGQTLRYYPTHFGSLPSLMLHHGDRGVRLFFVISGFILALPFARHYLKGGPAVPIGRYFLRRVTRLEPPYILSLLGLSVLVVLDLNETVSNVVVHLLATLAYSHNLIFGKASSISGVAWSLEVEIQFYILVPLLTAVFAIRSQGWRRFLLASAIVSFGLLQTWFPGSNRWQMSIGFFIQFFLAGLLLADFYTGENTNHKSFAWDAVSLVGWPVVFILPDIAVQCVLPALAVVLYWAAFHGRIANAFFRHPLVVCIGGACYSTYLLHFPTIAFATRLAGHQYAAKMWILSVTLIVLVSGTFFLLIEKPCMDAGWPRRMGRWLGLFQPHLPEHSDGMNLNSLEGVRSANNGADRAHNPGSKCLPVTQELGRCESRSVSAKYRPIITRADHEGRTAS